MKKTILCLLALVLSLVMLCTAVMAMETQEQAPDIQVVLTHVTLRPGADALGYKAKIVADEAVMSQVTAFGFELWLDGGKVVTYTKTENITATLAGRLQGILAAGGGEMNINGRAFAVVDGQTIYSDTYATSMKKFVETVNGQVDKLNKTQIQGLQKLLEDNAEAVAQWNIAEILNWQEKVSFMGGTYAVVAMAGDKCYALGTSATGGVAEAIDVTGESGQILLENAPEWTIDVLDQYGTVTLTSAEGKYLWRDGGKANLYISGSQKDQWKLAVDAEGYYTLLNTNTDSRYLAYNGSGFKAYDAASDSRFIQFMLIPTMDTVEIATGDYAVVAVAGDKYYAMGATAESGVVEAAEVTVEDGVVTNFDTNTWKVNVLNQYGTVTLTDAEGKYLMRADGSANLDIGSGETKWQVAVDECGLYTIANTNTDSRYLAYNGTGFKAYAAATEERFIQFMLLPVAQKPVLTSGQYMVVGITKDGQKAMGTTVTSGVVDAHNLVAQNGNLYPCWTVVIDDDGLATFKNNAGQYLVSTSGSANLAVGDTETKWTVGVSEDGYFTFRNTHADMRYLSYNGAGFKVYSNSSVNENGYDVKFMMIASSGLQTGRYAVVAKAGDKYYAVNNSASGGVIAAQEVALDNLSGANTWNVTVNADGKVTFVNEEGMYLNGTSSSSNMYIKSTATEWTVAVDTEGYYTFHMGRYLAYNGSGFKAYDAASNSRFIQFMLIPVNHAPSGKYNIVAQGADGKYYAMTNTVNGGVAAAQEVTVENGQLTTEGVDYWNVNMVYGNSMAVVTTADGHKLMRADGDSNLVLGNTSHKWLVTLDAETGLYTLVNVNSDSRYLSYNGTGFKAYAAATDVRIINLLLIPAE